MPIYVPPVSPLPDPLPLGQSLRVSGLATIGGVPGHYYAPAGIAYQTSNLSFLSVPFFSAAGVEYVGADMLGVSGNVTLDMVVDDYVFFTLAGNVTFDLVAGVAPSPVRRLVVVLKQDAIGGWTVTWPAAVRWSGGAAPVVTIAANAVSLVELDVLTDPVTGGRNMYGRFWLNYTSI